MPAVGVATNVENESVVSLITPAFANDPAGRRLYPVRLYGGPAFDRGGAHFVEGHMTLSRTTTRLGNCSHGALPTPQRQNCSIPASLIGPDKLPSTAFEQSTIDELLAS